MKVEDVEDPIAVGEQRYSIYLDLSFNDTPTVEEIVARTPPETLQKIYKIPEYHSTLEFLTMLALTNGRLLKVRTLHSQAMNSLTSL